MKSIRTKIILLVFSVILLCAGIIGGTGMYYAQSMAEENSVQIMNLIAEDGGRELDHVFFSIEQSVSIIANQVVTTPDMVQTFQNDILRKPYLENLKSRVLEIAESTEGAVAVYWHLNPEIAPPDAGIFYSRPSLSEPFAPQKVTDLSKEQPDSNPTSWYYIPVAKGKAVWLEPYYNGKSEEQVGSYVMPIYQNDVLLGVVGIDFLMDDIVRFVDKVKVYNSGYAYLINRGNELIYHPAGREYYPLENEISRWEMFLSNMEHHPGKVKVFEHNYNQKAYKTTYCNLENNMRLVVTAPTAEIDEVKDELRNAIIGGVTLISLICLFIGIWVSQGIVKPLKEIIETSKLVADGDLTVRLPLEAKDEVGELAVNLQRTVDRLRIYVDEVNEIAFRDPLTGVKSKTAYTEERKKLEENIQNGSEQFGILVFDVNNLKIINDNYGHDVGNQYLIANTNLICNCFKHSPIFRVGGDEFVAILRGQDLMNASSLLAGFYVEMQNAAYKAERPQDKVSIAVGYSFYDKNTDTGYQEVFNRADQSMYENKKLIKSGKEPNLPEC